MLKRTALVFTIFLLIAKVSFSAPGDLDPTFGEGGVFTYDRSDTDEASGVAIQEDGKIVILGYTIASSRDVLVLRLNPDGTLDNTFGDNGVVTYDGGDNDRGNAVAIQKDGKILVAGYCTKDTTDVLVLRYNPDGTLDNTFGDNGVVTYNGGGVDLANAVTIQEDGKIVVVGYTVRGTHDSLVLRYNPDGTLDNTFGDNGVVTYDGGYVDIGNGVAIQGDGKILVVGDRYNGTGEASDVLVLRYNPDGTLDNTFSGDGVVIYDSWNMDSGKKIAIQENGKIVVVGERYNTAVVSPEQVWDLLVLRYNPNGTLDNTFSGDGVAIYDSGNFETGTAIAIQEDGKIVIAGVGSNSSWADMNVLVLRLNTNGTLDETFGENGIVNYHGPAYSENVGSAMVVQMDGNIIITGWSYLNSHYDVLALRLHGSENPPTPNPMTWETLPHQTGTDSISMIASTATDPSLPISYYFDFVGSPTGGLGGADSGWQPGTSYTNSNLRANHKYGYRVKAKDDLNNQTAFSTTQYAYTAIQTPTGITFGTVTPASIQVRSTNTPTGLGRGKSGLWIENTVDATNNSGWKRDNTLWTSKSLKANTSYTFQAKARNGDGIETGYGLSASRYTRASLPGKAPFSDVTRTSIRANWTTSNPSGTQYFCQNVTTGANSGWITDTSWNSDNLTCGLSYSFRVKARNQDGFETGWTSLGSQSSVKCVLLLKPNGGETIPSGSSYDIQWEATPEAVSFDLFYSLDNGASWPLLKKDERNTIYSWAPKPTGNKKACFVRVIGYNATRTKKIGSDTSDKPFTIEVVRLTSPNGPPSLKQGDNINITWTANETTQPITKVQLYYTKDGGTTYNSIITLSGAYPPGDYSQPWTVPPVGTTPKTKCKVKVVLKDQKGVIRGSDASDNFFTIEPLVPDMIETSVSDPPATAPVGSIISITDTAMNQGNAGAGASTTRYYLSVNTSKGTGDILLTGTRDVPALAAGESSTGTVNVVRIPSSVAAGTYYVLACADDLKKVPEGNETNNCIASTSTVQIQRPDLIETSVTQPPATASVGSGFAVTDTAKNQGKADAGSSTTQYYLSADKIKGSGDTLLTGTRSVPALVSGATSTDTVDVIIPSGLAARAYYLLACADDMNVVAEGNETNNCIASTSTVQVRGPDLIETYMTNPPLSFRVGNPFSSTDTVENQGNVAAGDSVTRYYLSKDTVRDSGDVRLTGGRFVIGLAAGVSSIGSVEVTIPSGTAAGVYYLLACADDMEDVAETNDKNNCIASVHTVQVNP